MKRRRSGDVGIVLQAVYALFALAATGRSVVQLATHARTAPIPYALSAVAGLVYIAGLIALRLASRDDRVRRAAVVLCLIELTGVLVVGTLSFLTPEAFPAETVWSRFGSGYAFIPAVLPVVALWACLTKRLGSRS